MVERKNEIQQTMVKENNNRNQCIQEWTKWNLWKIVFRKFEIMWSVLIDQFMDHAKFVEDSL